jgi:hypothetical protein
MQAPFEHVPPPEQAAAGPMHELVPGSQQSPLVVQVALGQHVSPVAPHGLHSPFALQARPRPS